MRKRRPRERIEYDIPLAKNVDTEPFEPIEKWKRDVSNFAPADSRIISPEDPSSPPKDLRHVISALRWSPSGPLVIAVREPSSSITAQRAWDPYRIRARVFVIHTESLKMSAAAMSSAVAATAPYAGE